ncbi:MAG TPA: response regulator [Flavisolibacter sp.]|nr:response regulator [Flavisolibacter sp.]
MQNQRQCFLIDNDEDDREIFALALHEIDRQLPFETAAGGPEALARMSTDPAFSPTVIFLDMNMPLMSGPQCLQAIRDMERFRDTPVYILSTSSDPFAREEVLRLGATDFLVKPCSFGDMVALLSSVIQLQNQDHEQAMDKDGPSFSANDEQ